VGNALAAPFVVEFTTLRRITHKIALRANEGSTILGTGQMYSCPASMLAGDDDQNRPVRGVTSFDISSLPSGIAEFERATFSAQTQGFGGDPIAGLQALTLEHTAFPLPIAASARTGAALRSLGTLTTSIAERSSTLDVLTAIREDYAQRTARANRSQYRLATQRVTDNDDTGDGMTVHCSSIPPALDLVYLAP
jgi:hypothetical protein